MAIQPHQLKAKLLESVKNTCDTLEEQLDRYILTFYQEGRKSK